MHIYDTPALYGQHMGDQHQDAFMTFYRELFANCDIRTVHDCTIGAGGTTLPLARLGYTVSGSDISDNLLGKARENFAAFGLEPYLYHADLRRFDEGIRAPLDCVISTGNSLPHVNLEGVERFVKAAHRVLKDGGYLFFDIRNWDAIWDERPIIHAIDPKIMTADEHRSVYLLFNWHDDGSVTFSLANCYDRAGKHVSCDVVGVPPYYPLLRRDVLRVLSDNGFMLLRYVDMDAVWLAPGMEKSGKRGDFDADFDLIQQYGVFARKG